MEIVPQEYSLPDAKLYREAGDGTDWLVWQPEQRVLVLGAANQAAASLHLEKVWADQIPVFKRPSGGETVILTPNMLVISLRFHSITLDNPKVYFRRINGILIRQLSLVGITGITEKGISDLVIGEQKILGSSIYRRRTMVFYHAVLNISESIEIISKYLKHPAREPDYRLGRSHEEFVTSVGSHYPHVSIVDIKESIVSGLLDF